MLILLCFYLDLKNSTFFGLAPIGTFGWSGRVDVMKVNLAVAAPGFQGIGVRSRLIAFQEEATLLVWLRLRCAMYDVKMVSAASFCRSIAWRRRENKNRAVLDWVWPSQPRLYASMADRLQPAIAPRDAWR